jgi:hypothetical protein
LLARGAYGWPIWNPCLSARLAIIAEPKSGRFSNAKRPVESVAIAQRTLCAAAAKSRRWG